MTRYLSLDVDHDSPEARRMFGKQSKQPNGPPNPAVEGDRTWFEENPTRCIQMRAPMDGDQPLFGGALPNGGSIVLVFCPSTGGRLRLPVRLVHGKMYPLSLVTRADEELSKLLVPALDEVRSTLGNARVNGIQVALLRCLVAGARLKDFTWYA